MKTAKKTFPEVTKEEIEGIAYYSWEYRKTYYTLSFSLDTEEWCLFSKRQGMRSGGTFKFFKSLMDVEAKFKGLEMLFERICNA